MKNKLALMFLAIMPLSCAMNAYVKDYNNLKNNFVFERSSINIAGYTINCKYDNNESFDNRYSYVYKSYKDLNWTEGDFLLISEKDIIREELDSIIIANSPADSTNKYFINIDVVITRNFKFYQTILGSILCGITLTLYPAQIDGYTISFNCSLFSINSNNKIFVKSFEYKREIVERVGFFCVFNNFQYGIFYGDEYTISRNTSFRNSIDDILYDLSSDMGNNK